MSDMEKTLRSFRFAFEGIGHAIRNHQNLKWHIVAAVAVTLLTLFLGVPKYEFLMVVLAIMFVIFAEMVNTAIEEMTDLITQEHRRQAKIAKDISAASVLIASLFAVITAVVIFTPYIF